MKRLHVHVSVPDLEQGIAFYSALFDATPEVEKDDYAKWLLEHPAVNFAISTTCGETGLNHLGFQMDSDEELNEIQGRLDQIRVSGFEERDAQCCYAHSNKYWTRDPAGIAWEQFHTLAANDEFGTDLPDESATGSCGCHDKAGQASNQKRCCA